MSKKTLLDDVLLEAKQVKELATKNAHTILVETLSNKVSKAVKEAIDSLDDEDSEEKEEKVEEEAKDQEVLDLDELPKAEDDVEEAKGDAEAGGAVEFGGEEETPEEKELKKKSLKAQADEVRLGEASEEGSEDKDEEEFSDDEIEEVYNEIFKEVEIPPLDGKLDPEDHLEEPEKKEKPFDQQEPPAAKDFLPKEAMYKRAIGRAGRRILEMKRYFKSQDRKINELRGVVKEVSLLNAKLVSVSKLSKLTESVATREKIIEIIDAATSVNEVRRLEAGAMKLIEHLANKGVQKSPLTRSTSMPTGKQTIREDASDILRRQELAGIKVIKEDK